MQKRKYILIPMMLLVLFVTYQAGITVFSHIHYVNGVMIVHSHPSDDNHHTHTEGQVLTLAHVSHWAGIEPVCITLDERDFRFMADRHTHCISLRAPPFC